jgi:REP element-mobilizing transposase RayT
MEPEENSTLPKRQRRLDSVFNSTPSYFLTLCTEDRTPVLANDKVHQRVRQFAAGSMARYRVWVDSYVLMPDHAHLIVTVAGDTKLSDWIKAFKAFVGSREFQWQESFFDHLLRSDESRSEKWQYIRMNPVRAGLVERADDWPYAGWFDRRTGAVGRVTPPGDN